MELRLEVIKFNTEDVIATSGAINYFPLSTVSGYEEAGHIALYSELVGDSGNNSGQIKNVINQGSRWVLWTPLSQTAMAYNTIPAGYKREQLYTWYDSGVWYTEGKTWDEMANAYGLNDDPTGWRTSN